VTRRGCLIRKVMSYEMTFTCPLKGGIHARPASAIEAVCGQFSSSITLINERTGSAADAHSVLEIIAADIRHGDPCRCIVDGLDGRAAYEKVKTFFDRDFALCDEPLPQSEPASGSGKLPMMLRLAGTEHLSAMPMSPGIGRGMAFAAGGPVLPAFDDCPPPCREPSQEWEIARAAIDRVRNEFESRIAAASSAIERGVLTAHRGIASDPSLTRALQRLITQSGLSCSQGIVKVCEELSAPLRNSQSLLVRERVADLHDIAGRLLAAVGVVAQRSRDVRCTVPSIVIAENLTPGQFLALDRTLVQGLALSIAGATSHTVILARGSGIPVIAGIEWDQLRLLHGREVVVDANAGFLLPRITEVVERYFDLEIVKQQRIERRRARMSAHQGMAAGVTMEIGVNIALAEEAAPAFGRGADGIGLFRTEMLFLDRDQPPGEEEQYQAYRTAAEAAGGKPVIIRTLDIGGDKQVPYLRLPSEANPFLGLRGIRLYGRFSEIVRTQVRAIVRASAHGRIKLLIPMVTSPDEVRALRDLLAQAQTALRSESIAFDPAMPVGIMVEVPAVALSIDAFCDCADFFCIGTNDLVQYLCAADRQNQNVSDFNNPFHPGHVRILDMIIQTAHHRGRWVGLCGQMAGNERALPLLAGLGLDEISVDAPRAAGIKSLLGVLNPAECRALVPQAAGCATAAQVERLLSNASISSSLPIIDPDLVVVQCRGRTKAEIIKEAADILHIAGRVSDAPAFEEAIWQREQVYATGLGHGFAVPHCKSGDGLVRASSIALLKPASPIEWSGPEEPGVNVVVVLAVRETKDGNEHLKIFARLARKIMHEDFRDFLLSAEDPALITDYLIKNLQLFS
jgi:fructose-specific PTS system IIA-like component